jgi:hypothetical protein
LIGFNYKVPNSKSIQDLPATSRQGEAAEKYCCYFEKRKKKLTKPFTENRRETETNITKISRQIVTRKNPFDKSISDQDLTFGFG